MNYWVIVIAPAVITALLVRLDAKVVGPYFALSSLVEATEGLDARFFYGDHSRRLALYRRFLYPIILGFILGIFRISAADVASSGGIAAGLLIWPVIFHGLPVGISRRYWEVPVLYASFLAAFPALAVFGKNLNTFLGQVSKGHIFRWFEEQLFSLFIIWIIGVFFAALYRYLSNRVAKRASEPDVPYLNNEE